MAKYSTMLIRLILGLTWLTLGCQSLTEATSLGVASPPAASGPWPHSTFVPNPANIQVKVGQELYLESRHLSPHGLGALEILVNGKPAGTIEANPQAFSLPDTLASVEFATLKVVAPNTDLANRVCLGAPCDQLITEEISVQNQPIRLSSARSPYPNSSWTVFLLWTGRLPGTYDLSIQVTDNAQNKGPWLTQRIEVVE
ncbi:MAG: hypothetical protein JW953_13150 [Anaerolineae bacterium]|nr:hypothetical protein [Anaerolineae bacterium]